ncbi:condensin-2 complex subunit D3 [Tanacetum coccineum]
MDESSEMEEESAVKGRVTQAVKHVQIQNTIPMFIELKHYKSEIDEMLVADKQLQKELTYDMQKYETLKAKSTAAEAVSKGKGVSENHLNTSSKVSSAMAGARAEVTAKSVLRDVNQADSKLIEKWLAPTGAWFLLSEVSGYLLKAVDWEFLYHHWQLLDKHESINSPYEVEEEEAIGTAPSLYIQAWLTTGKICLADDKLAKRYIPLFVQEMENSNDAALHNNIIVMMADFCVRYNALIDCYIPNVFVTPVNWSEDRLSFFYPDYYSFVEAIYVLNDCNAHTGQSNFGDSVKTID